MELKKLRVLLVDDHVVLLSGLRLLLDNTPDIKVVGDATSGPTALEQCRRLKPDVVVLDINLGEASGLDLVPLIKQTNPETHILLLTMYGEEEYLDKALKLGAKGYILKKASDSELLMGIRAVGRGETFLDPVLATSFVERVLKTQKNQANVPANDDLSSREKEVLGLVVLGYTNQQIADDLVISIKTVETHKANIKRKLGIQRRSDLVRYAIEHRIVSPK